MSSLAQGDDGRHGLVALQVTALAIQLFSAGLDNVANQIGNTVIGLFGGALADRAVTSPTHRRSAPADELFVTTRRSSSPSARRNRRWASGG